MLGELLTTPTHLLKLILPLPISIEKDTANNGRDFGRAVSPNDRIQPLALLVHPQQPLAYIERLIQAELPPVIQDGKEKIPNIYFRAEDTGDGASRQAEPQSSEASRVQNTDTTSSGSSGSSSSSTQKGKPTHVATYSGLGREGPERAHADKKWVRWSSSTEMGDFIRDAARGREFVVEIEGHGAEVRVGVPSFRDRTHYLRLRLRKMSREIDALAAIKRECDIEARRSAHRLAQGGLVLLAGWWGIVYYMTFQTKWGWDLVEPVTYLVGLTTIMAGYLWFLYISRDLSYKAAMNITVSRRQNALYEAKGFDLHRWESLVQEANSLRKEIKTIAVEYDVDWDEAKDVGDEVKKVLEKERGEKGGGRRRKVSGEDQEEEEDEGEEQGDILRENQSKKEEGKK